MQQYQTYYNKQNPELRRDFKPSVAQIIQLL